MTQPIAPDAIRQHPDQTEASITKLIDTINRILELDISVVTLMAGKPVEIYDASNSVMWQLGHVRAIEEFKAIGWQITERKVGSTDSQTVYYFSLPEAK